MNPAHEYPISILSDAAYININTGRSVSSRGCGKIFLIIISIAHWLIISF